MAQEPYLTSTAPFSLLCNTSIITNDSSFWSTPSAGVTDNLVTVAFTFNDLGLTYPELKRDRAGFIMDIGNGTSTGFMIGRTDYTSRAFFLNATFTIPIGGIVAANSVRDGSWCHAMQDLILAYVFGNGSPSIAGTFYFGLSTTAIAADGTGITEPGGGSYARVAVTANSTNFGFLDEYLSTWANKLAIAFPAPTGAWGECIYGFISDASSAGNIVAKWPLNRPVSPVSGQQAPTYYARSMHFQV
jgi:hypothetical protein